MLTARRMGLMEESRWRKAAARSSEMQILCLGSEFIRVCVCVCVWWPLKTLALWCCWSNKVRSLLCCFTPAGYQLCQKHFDGNVAKKSTAMLAASWDCTQTLADLNASMTILTLLMLTCQCSVGTKCTMVVIILRLWLVECHDKTW